MPKLDSTQIQTDATQGIGGKPDVAVVGATDRPLVNLGFRQASVDPSNLSQGRAWFRTDQDHQRLATTLGVIRTGGLVAMSTTINTVANTTAQTNVGCSFTFPANSLIAGKGIKFEASGPYTAAGATTIRQQILLGAANIDFGAGAVTAGTRNWVLRGYLFIDTPGVAGVSAIRGQADKVLENGFAFGMINLTTLDTTVANTLTFALTWGAAAVGNTLSHYSSYIEVFN
jgi:hypothetical protein